MYGKQEAMSAAHWIDFKAARETGKVLLIGLAFLGLALVFRNSWVSGIMAEARSWLISPHALHSLDIPWVNAGIFVLAGGVLVGAGVPRLWISALAGAVYGLVQGTFLGLAASCLGAALVYGAGRSLLSRRVTRLSGARLAYWRERFRKNAFVWVLYPRLFPLSNATATALLSGSCRVPFVSYMAGSVLGFVPLTLVMSLMGEGSIRGSHVRILTGTACLILLHLVLFAAGRLGIGEENPSSGGEGDTP